MKSWMHTDWSRVALLALLALSVPVSAANRNWDPSKLGAAGSDGLGNWDTSSTLWWNGAADVAWVNANNDRAIIGNGGTAGTITLTTPITVGGFTFNTTASGSYTITGSTLTFSGPSTAYNDIVANQPATISSTIAATTPFVFTKGTVTLALSGNNTANQFFNVGPAGSVAANAAVRITGGINSFGQILVGRGNSYAGALYISGGTTTFTGGGNCGVGVGSGGALNADPSATGTSFGFMEVSGGAVNCIEWNIGNRDRGVLYVNGGTVNNTSWGTRIGGRNGGSGVLDISSGVWNQSTANGTYAMEFGPSSATTVSGLNIRGGTLNIQGNKQISISNAAILNMGSSGLLATIPFVDGNGTLNFNGGTIQARLDRANFLANSGGIYFNVGGATIDTQGYTVGIAGNLLAPTGNGVTGVSGFSTLTGMVAAPMVVITGGGGSGATAIADFNSGSGSVTGITVTNPGRGYTSAPTFTLYAGGAALAPTYTGTYAANSSGGLTKLGAGTLSLTGANTYAGETRVKAGKLQIGGTQTSTSGIALENATFLDLTSSLTVKTLTLGTAGTDSMQLNLQAGATANRNITVQTSGGLNAVANTGNVKLGVGNGGWTAGNKYALINYSGAIGTTGFGAFSLTADSAAYGSLVDDAGVVNFLVNAIPDPGPYTYTGAVDGNWNLVTRNFNGTGGFQTIFNNSAPNAVTFNDAASGPTGIVLGATLTPSQVTVTGTAKSYTFGGPGKLSGGMALIKSGTTTLTIGTGQPCDYTGGTQLNGGTVKLGSATAIPLTGTSLTFGGGTLDINGNSVTAGGLSGTSGGVANSGAAATLTISHSSGTATFGGTLTGAALLSVTKSGAGTQVLSSVGCSIGTLSITGGTLLLDNSIAGAPTMTLASAPNISTSTVLWDINNATLTTPGLTMQDGRMVVRGSSSLITTGGNLTLGTGDSKRSSVYLKNSATVNGTGRVLNMGPGFSQQDTYCRIQDNAQATFSTAYVLANANYCDGRGHGSVLEISDTGRLTTSGILCVMSDANDQNRSGTLYAHAQAYQHGGTVTVGGNLSLADNDRAVGTGAATHKVLAAYNLWTGSALNVAGRILGGATRTGYGQSFFNFHGGTLAYAGAGAQADWINLTATAGTAGTTSAANLRIWEGATIDTGNQNLTVSQALLAPTGQGISAISTAGLTTQVYANDIPPWVYISGGGGLGATAVATLDSGGRISGFVITNPGFDYTSTPTVELIRANETVQAAAAGNITLSANSTYTGGLTKKGSGTLTLSGVSTYTGSTTIQQGTVKLGVANAIAAGGLVLQSAGTLDANNFTPTFAGAVSLQGGAFANATTITKNSGSYDAQSGSYGINLSGSAGLTKTTAGTFSLTANQAYTGPTAVNQGTLSVAGTLASSGVTVADGAALTAAGSGATLSALTCGSTGTDQPILNVTVGGPILTVTATDGLTVNGQTKINVGGTLVIGQQYVLIDYAGTLQGTGQFLPQFTGRSTGHIVVNTANSSIDVVIDAADNPKWTGATDGNWDTTTVNWKLINGGTATTFFQGSDSVLFDETAAGTGNIVLTGAMSPVGTTVNNVAKPYTFGGAGKLTGATGLLKQGSGTLLVNNAGGNDYAGDTRIEGGTLQSGVAHAIPAASAIVVAGGTLDLNGQAQSNSGGVTLQSGTITGGTLTKNNGAYVVASGAVTTSGVLAGSAGLTKNTAGTVTLSGASAYTGATAINAGTLQLSGAPDRLPTATAVTLANDASAILDLSSQNQTIGSLAGAGPSGAVTLGGGTLTVGDGGNTSYAGVISGAGNVVKQGAGTLTLSGSNLYGGTTTIGAGTLQISGAADRLPTATAVTLANVATAKLDLNSLNQTIGSLAGGGGTGGNVTLGSGRLTVGDANSTAYTGIISGTGSLSKQGGGALTLNAANTFNGDTRIGSGALSLGIGTALQSSTVDWNVADSGVFNFNALTAATFGGLKGGRAFSIPASLNLSVGNNNQNTAYSGVLTGGASSTLTKIGSGTQALSSSGSVLPTVDITAGTLSLDNSVTTPSLQITTAGDACLRIRGAGARFSMNAGTLTLNGRFRLGSDNSIGTAAITGGTVSHTANNIDMGFNAGRCALTLGGTAIYNGTGRTLEMSNANYCNSLVIVKDGAVATFGAINIDTTNGGAMQYGMLNLSGSATVTASSMTVGVSQNQNNGNVALATVNQTGGTCTINGVVTLANNNQLAGTPTTALQGTYNLAGGTLTANQVLGGGAGIGGQARLNFHGGTLAINAAASAGQAGNFISLTANSTDGKAYIYEGGTIDTGSKDVTIIQALLTPAGQGVTGIPVTAAGSGYFVPPAVRITRGGGDTTGTGASATAEVNPATGAITGITITNPGTDYSTAPTATLDRGDGAGATLGTVTIGANAYTGGLTKKGTGTLTLTGVSTYTGATTVETGTLLVNNTTGSGTGAGNVTVNGGAKLGGTGTIAGSVTVQGTGELLPGASAGTLTVNTDLTLAAGATCTYELSTTWNGANDKVVVGGNLNLNDNVLKIQGPASPLNLDQTTDYELMSVGGATGITGSFDPTPTWVGTAPANAAFFSVVTDTVNKKVLLHYQNLTSYTITASAGANGSISPLGAIAVIEGRDQTFTIAPSPAYLISDVLVDGASVGAVPSYTFTNVTEPHTIAASFVHMPDQTITASAGAGGTISPNGAVTVTAGANQTFTIARSTGYRIVDVAVDGVPQGPIGTYTFSFVVAPHTIAATFAAIPDQTITATAGAGGAISPSGSVTVTGGENQTFAILPSSGYRIADVAVDSVSQGAINAYTFTYVTAPHTIAATFAALDRNLPRTDQILFSAVTDNFPADGQLTGNWPTYVPVGQTLTALASPTVELLGGVKWQKNLNADGDGYRLGGSYWDGSGQHPIACSGATIIAAVKPLRNANGGTRGEVVDIFYDRLALSIGQGNGQVQIARNGWFFGYPATIPDGQVRIMSLVVQPTGQFKVFANGVEIVNETSTSDMTSLVPGVSGGGANGFGTFVNVGRNNPDGWSTYNGNIGDVFVYKTALTEAERIQVQNIVRDKFAPAAASTTTLGRSPDRDTVGGETVTFTAVVTGAGTPTGEVTFYDGALAIGTATLVGGQASLPVTTLAEGLHSITASYAGDWYNAASVSAALPHTVTDGRPTTTTTLALTAGHAPSYPGQAVTFTATVAGSAPSGSVTFKDGATVLGAGTLDGAGLATLTTSALALGAHSLTAEYAGDVNNKPSASAPLDHTVAEFRAVPTVTLTSGANPSVIGVPVTFTVAVTGSGTASGLVTLKEGATALGTGTLDGSARAGVVTALHAPLGAHSLTAEYAGDDNNQPAASAPLLQTVNARPPPPRPTDLLFSVVAESLPASGATGAWASYLPAGQNYAVIGAPTAETIDGARWEFNRRGSTGNDGYLVGTSPSDIPVSGVTIVVAVRPKYLPGLGGERRGEVVSVFYNELFLAVDHEMGEVIVNHRNYHQERTGYVIPDGQKTVLALLVQPTGRITLYANGVQKWTTETGEDYTRLALSWANKIVIGNNGYDGWASFSGNIGDVFVYKTALTDAERVQVEYSIRDKVLPAAASTATLERIVGTSPCYDDEALTLRVTVTGAGTPTGNVVIYDGANAIRAGVLAAGQVSIGVASLAPGAHSFTARYEGDFNNAASVSSPLAQTVTLRPATMFIVK